MKVVVRTKVQKDIKMIFSSFDQELFMKLNPPGISAKVTRFEGCLKGCRVELELLLFGFIKQKWMGEITNHSITEKEIYFIDEAHGKQLPFFLQNWIHKHIICETKEGNYIIDEIDFRSPFGLSFLFYPFVYLQMKWRSPIYKKEFSSN